MNRTCDRFHEMISVDLDGELSDEESARLTEHMADCPSCREVNHRMHRLQERLLEHERTVESTCFRNRAARESAVPQLPGRVNGSAHSARYLKAPNDSRSVRHRGKKRLAIGASIAGAVALASFFVNQPETGRTQPASDLNELAPRLVKVTVLNERTQEAQAREARMLEMELRLLLVEAKNSGADPATIEQLENQIAAMIQRVDSLNNAKQIQPMPN